MKKLTPRLLIAGLLISSRSLAADLCSAFVRLSIQRKARRSCTCWASTDLTDTAFWSADSARGLSGGGFGPEFGVSGGALTRSVWEDRKSLVVVKRENSAAKLG